MDTRVSSASPAALARYALLSADVASGLEAEARWLEAALRRFESRCSEYRVSGVSGLPERLRSTARQEAELASWVGDISTAFREADNSGLGVSVDAPQVANLLLWGVSASPLAPLAAPVVAGAEALAPKLPGLTAEMGVDIFFGQPQLAGSAAARVVGPIVRDIMLPEAWHQAQIAMGIPELQQAFNGLGSALGSQAASLAVATRELGVGAGVEVALATPFGAGLDAALHLSAYGQIAETLYAGAWNLAGFQLLNQLTVVDATISSSGDDWPVVMALLAPILGPNVAGAGGNVLGLVVIGALPTVPFQETSNTELLHRLEQSFWKLAFAEVSPPLLIALARKIDQLSLETCTELDRCANLRPDEAREPIRDLQTGELDVPVSSLFPLDVRAPGENGGFFVKFAALMFGQHALISYKHNEQVRLMQLNANTYAIGIAGLDPDNPGEPNGFEAVIRTSLGQTEHNAYYQQVKERFLRNLERIPPGSEIVISGHSMGGGMSVLLANDPEVSERLRARGCHVTLVVTFGMVRPDAAGVDEVPSGEPGGPYDGTTVVHFVNNDDQLSHQVGARQDPARYPGLVSLGDSSLGSPTDAHTSYGNYDSAAWRALPPELQLLPIEIDPRYLRVFGEPPPALPPPLEAPATAA